MKGLRQGCSILWRVRCSWSDTAVRPLISVAGPCLGWQFIGRGRLPVRGRLAWRGRLSGEGGSLGEISYMEVSAP